MSLLDTKLNEIVGIYAKKRVNGEVASDRTMDSCGQVLRTCFRNLVKLGYKIQEPENLTEKHIAKLCEHWYGTGISKSTMQERLSRLRVFVGWIEKPWKVKSLRHYLPNVDPKELVVSRIAKASKSWTELGIDVAAKIKEADSFDWRFGLMLRLELAFGLRRVEVVQLKPWKSDKGDKLAIYEAKNGRPRDIYIDTEEQRVVLDQVKAKIAKGAHLGWPTNTRGQPGSLQYSIGRYNKSMAKIGITREESSATGHGLRAQFAENAALIAHLIPPTLGGTGGQMPRDDLNVALAQVSELLGHSRVCVTGSYYGSFGRDVTPDVVNRCKHNIERGLLSIESAQLTPVPSDRLNDCLLLVGELSVIDVEATPKQVHALWIIHSDRHATGWVRPREGNAEALEVAAMKIAARREKNQDQDNRPSQ